MTGFGGALQAFQIGAQLGGALIPGLAILFERLEDDAVELGGNAGLDLRWRRGRLGEQAFEDRRNGRALGRAAGRRPSRKAPRLLKTSRCARRSPGRAPAQGTCRRRCQWSCQSSSIDPTRPLVAPVSERTASLSLATPKSSTLIEPRLVTNRFAGLRSRWTTPLACAASSASASCTPSSSTSSTRQRASRDPILQRLPVEQLHHHEVLGRLSGRGVMRADVVERADIGMVKARDHPRFALEPLVRVRVGIGFVGQELDRHPPAEARVFRFVDHAHAAGAEPRQDLVVRDGFADHSAPISCSSSTSRIFLASCSGVNGFCRNGLPSSSTPVRTIASSM